VMSAPRAMGGLDHDDAERSARDQPVAPGKLAGARLVASGISKIAGPLGRDDRRQQLLVFGRIDPCRLRYWRDAPPDQCRAPAPRRSQAGLAEIARQLA
jgi:hypothetical protein